MSHRIHIVGASGSGTSTLAAAIAQRWGHRHLDTDHYFWLPTDPPFQSARPADERLSLLRNAFAENDTWVLSGSLCGWGDPLIPEFELVVFLYVPQPTRLERLKARELGRYGQAALSPGGRLHQTHVAFMDWAAQYDAGGPEVRSRALHERWLTKIQCPVVRIEGCIALDDSLQRVAAMVSQN